MKKKMIACLLIVVAVSTLLTACSSFTCDICGEKKYGNKYATLNNGFERVFCEDCNPFFR